MNTIFILAGFCLAGHAEPLLTCATPNIERGDVKAGPALVQIFVLDNKDSLTKVRITKVEASCGCLRRSLTCEILKPGESTQLQIEINTLTQPDGPNRWQVAVFYTVERPDSATAFQPEMGQLLLSVSATLSREVNLSPAQVAFSTESEADQTLKLTDRRPKPLRVLRAEPSTNHLTVKIGSITSDPNGLSTQSITIKLLKNAPVGHRDESVTLLTDDPAYPELRVPVRILKRVHRGVSATPESLHFRLGAQSDASALVQLRAGDGAMISIASAESDLLGVAVKWSSGSGIVATMRVTLAETTATTPGSCRIRVRMAEPAGQELLIPVKWTK